MADPTDLKGQHAREFTNHELLTLRVWFDLDRAGNDVLAESVLNAGLMLEHYTSLLDNDPSKRGASEVAAQSQLAFAFQQELEKAEEFFRDKAKDRQTVLFHERMRILEELNRANPTQPN